MSGTRRHSVSLGVTRRHSVSLSVTQHHPASLSVTRHHAASRGVTRHHSVSPGITVQIPPRHAGGRRGRPVCLTSPLSCLRPCLPCAARMAAEHGGSAPVRAPVRAAALLLASHPPPAAPLLAASTLKRLQRNSGFNASSRGFNGPPPLLRASGKSNKPHQRAP